MILKRYLLLAMIFGVIPAMGQAIDHWETVVYDSMKWRYWIGTSDPGTNWQTNSFNDASWPEGRGSIGYGDGDDRTIIGVQTMSVFLRKKFTISNLAEIKAIIMHVDYDDGFIAYLNGVEIFRSYMNAGVVQFNQPSNGLHEALLYQGQSPEQFTFSNAQLSLLTAGENVLAIQVHNSDINSSDLTSSVFLSVGVSTSAQTYLPIPSWFSPMSLFLDSNLPIIKINTNGQAIQDEQRIVAHMGIIDNGIDTRNGVSDIFNNYDGNISIEIRGESSQMFPKKSFRIETQDASGNNLNAALLGMPAENDWVLYAPYTDKTMMRDVLAFKMGRDLGDYASRTRYVELVINGDYHGVYVLMERIKRDKNRVDIATLLPQDIAGDELTGGYLLRVDKLDNNDFPGWVATPTPMLPGERDITFQFFDPKGDELGIEQQNYIKNYMRRFQNSLTSTNFKDETTGYRSFIDIPSLLNFLIVSEIGKNVDSYIFSTYLYKEKDSDGGKLHVGPLWDFNLAFGNVDYWNNSQVAPGWIWNDGQRMFWFRRMMADPLFLSNLKCRWQSLRTTSLTNDYFTKAIDSIALLLGEAQVRNYKRWPILGTYVWPNQYVGATYANEVSYLKQWISNRLAWMDTNLSGACEPYRPPVITAVIDEQDGFTIYPNPFINSVDFEVNNYQAIKQIQVMDLTGRELFKTEFSGTTYNWTGIASDGSVVPDGLYIVRLMSASGQVIGMKKLMKRQ
jgi:hypothetical protein